MAEMREAHRNQKGSVLVTALLILVVINLLAISLVQTSVKESKITDFKTTDSMVFQVTESCTRDAIEWLKNKSEAPTSLLPYSITEDNIDYMFTGEESDQIVTRLSGYSYSCTVTDTSYSESGISSSTGEDVGGSGGYGLSGDTSPKHYYKITSVGTGPKGASKTIYTIVSAEY